MTQDQSLAATTPDPAAPFTRPAPATVDIDAAPAHFPAQLSVAQILEQARLPERRAKVCTRADLQARYDEIIEELGGLVSATGELVVDPEAPLGESTALSRARELEDELSGVRAQMSASMWYPLFRGLSSEGLAVFEKKYLPTEPNADMRDYTNRLIAKCAVDPVMSIEEVQSLRKSLGFKAFYGLTETVRQVNHGGGVDVPKSLGFSLAPQEK